jgi:pyruvate/oxaloacetate carboxyltransferase
MSTTETNHIAAVESGSLGTQKVTSRAYIKISDKGEIEDIQAKAETEAKNDKGLSVNWARMEEKGWTQFNENEFIRYIVKDQAGFEALVADPAQRIRIIQAGVDYIQNSRANAMSKEIKEGTGGKDEPTAEPAYNGETIDLKEAINTQIEKRSVDQWEKLRRQLAAMGLDEAAQKVFISQVAQQRAAQLASARSTQPELTEAGVEAIGDASDEESLTPTEA